MSLFMALVLKGSPSKGRKGVPTVISCSAGGKKMPLHEANLGNSSRGGTHAHAQCSGLEHVSSITDQGV